MGGVQGGAIVNFLTGGGTGGGATFTLNGTTDSVSLVAGANVTLNSGASSITIIAGGGTGGAAGTNTISASGTSIAGTALSLALAAGANISLQTATAANSMTVSVSGLNALSASTYASSTGTMTLTAGAGITITTAGSVISLIGNTTAVATNFSLNASSSSVSLVAGAGIGLASNLSTITISNSSPNLFSTISLSASGNTTGATSSGTANNVLAYSGMGIVSIGAGNGTISISATTPSVTNFSTISLSASGNTTGATSSGTYNNVLAFSGMGGVSVGAGNGTISISGATVPVATNFSLNASSSSVSLVAGPNISFASGASSITISGENALSFVGSASSTGTVSIIAGTGISISSNGANGQINFLTTGSAVTGFAISSITAGGVTQGTTSVASGEIQLVAGSNITLSSSAGAITLIGPSPQAGAAGTNTISASGTSIVGTALSLALFAGNNLTMGTATGAGSMSITFGDVFDSRLSLTQNINLNEIGGSVASASGTVTGTAGFGSSLFLNRIQIPSPIVLSEVDLALAMSFAATSNGAGTMSQSFVIYSFGNSSSLASVGSASATYAWQTGTSTSGAVVSLTQFQGGWSVPKIHPMTFATSSITAGEYVVGNLINFAQGSSTWTVNIFGAGNFISNTTSISAFSSSASAAITAFSAAPTAATDISLSRTSAYARIQSSTSSSQTIALTAFSGAPVGATVISNSGTGASSFLSTGGLTQVIPQFASVPNFVYIGTGSTTSALPSVFIGGIMSTGAVPVAITLTSAAVTYWGTAAGAQPYFALVGS